MRTMGPRRSTLARWREEGLPAGVSWFPELCRQLGVQYDHPKIEVVDPGVDFRMIPTFEEKVLEHRDGHYIVQDWMGNITEISDQYDYSYIRNAVDFVTRKWHRFPVESRDDFEQMKRRYDPDAVGRFPEDFAERVRLLAERDYPVQVNISGPFLVTAMVCSK